MKTSLIIFALVVCATVVDASGKKQSYAQPQPKSACVETKANKAEKALADRKERNYTKQDLNKLTKYLNNYSK